MHSYMSKHTTVLPYRSIHLYILYRVNMSMDTQTFPLKVETTVATLAVALSMMISTITKQLFALEDPKYCNMYEPCCYNLEYNDSQQC